MSPREPFAVTGLGAVSAAGLGVEALWAAALAARPRLAPVTRFAAREPSGVVPGFGVAQLGGEETNADAQTLCLAFAEAAAREALASARLDPTATSRIGLVLGTNIVDRPRPYAALVADLADALQLTGPRLAVSTACASGTTAIAVGFELLALASADAVLVGGADALTAILLAGFRTLKMLAPDRCAPFSLPPGTSLGEGAGFIVLEPLARARTRGLTPTLALRGHGLAADAFHATRPDPRGEGLVRSLGGALRHAGLTASQLVHVDLHATGTEANDAAESLGLARLLAPASPRSVACSASKSLLGHAQGAAGALETILLLRARADGRVPATLSFREPRLGCDLDPVAEGVPRSIDGDVIAKYSAGFGGANAALIFASVTREPAPRSTRPLALHGWFAADEQIDASDEHAAHDPLTRALISATRGALADAGLQLRRDDGDAIGLCLAQPRVSPESYRRLLDAVARRGLDRLSTQALVRALLGAPAGACCEALGLRGPLCVLAADASAELPALILAAQQLAARPELTGMLAAHASESDDHSARARCLLLRPADTVQLQLAADTVQLQGWSLQPASDLTAARSAALAHAGLPATTELPVHHGPGLELLHALRRREFPRGLWLADDDRGHCCAVVLARG